MPIRFLLTLVLLWLSISGNSQSLEYAKTLINKKQYLEAAKQLRPLADSGNAEAQYWAASLFFDGKGVQKSKEQGIKYSTLSANQGCLPAIYALINYYEADNDAHNYFVTLQKYVSMFPKLKDDELGCRLGYAYLRGIGVEKDDLKGWNMIENSIYGKDFIVDKSLKSEYYDYKVKQMRLSCIEDYADYLFSIGGKEKCEPVWEYIDENVYHYSPQQVKNRAESGNAWAMAIYASYCMKDNNINEAKKWAEMSAKNGSHFGKSMLSAIEKEELKRISFYVFGSRKELLSMGLLDKNGQLQDGFDRNYATVVDNTKVINIRLYASSARLLSTHPRGSYELGKDRLGQYVLKITHPTEFWKGVDLLVIQTN